MQTHVHGLTDTQCTWIQTKTKPARTLTHTHKICTGMCTHTHTCTHMYQKEHTQIHMHEYTHTHTHTHTLAISGHQLSFHRSLAIPRVDEGLDTPDFKLSRGLGTGLSVVNFQEGAQTSKGCYTRF